MSPPRNVTGRPRVWDDPRIVTPTLEAWTVLSPTEREAAVQRILAVFDEYREAMTEGTRHFRAKSGAAADLDGHFHRAGRAVFTACELGVLYPGEAVIVPDVLAVMDCDPDLEVDSWVVADRGRGIDLVLEVRNTGAKHKDLVENVRDYARLGIPEYFSFDCRSAQLRGWRLPSAGARAYRPIIPQGGYLASAVLGLELAVVARRLRFFSSGAMVPSEGELAARLQTMVDEQQRALEDTADRLARTQAALALAILEVCAARGLSLSADLQARVTSEQDPAALVRWLARAATAATADEALSEG